MARVELTFEQPNYCDKFLIFRTNSAFDFNSMPQPIGESYTQTFTDLTAPDGIFIKYCVASVRGEIVKYSDVLEVNTGAVEPTLLFVSAGTYGGNINDNYATVNYPTTLTPGDLIILLIGARESSGTIPTPPGFTEVGFNASEQPGVTARLRVFYKYSSGAESGSVSVLLSSGRPYGQMFAFRTDIEGKSVVVESFKATQSAPQPENIRAYISAPEAEQSNVFGELVFIAGAVTASPDSQCSDAAYTKATSTTTSSKLGVFYKISKDPLTSISLRRQNAPLLGDYEYYAVGRISLKII